MKSKLQRIYEDLTYDLRVVTNKLDTLRLRIDAIPDDPPLPTRAVSVAELAAMWT